MKDTSTKYYENKLQALKGDITIMLSSTEGGDTKWMNLNEESKDALCNFLECKFKKNIDRITDAKDVYDHLKEHTGEKQEHFWVITLDGNSKIINTRLVFKGTLNQSLVHPREVFADAISDRAAGIIISHNHPSGALEASRADMKITQRLKEVAKLLGIELLDHVIIAETGYMSFCDDGLL